MRTGWDDQSRNAPRLAKIAEDCGVQMITVHGRTRCQLYNGKSDWAFIKKVKEAVQIPVIGNGDVTSLQDAEILLEQSGANGVMIGRGAYGRPWFPNQVGAYLKEKIILADPPLVEQYKIIKEHVETMLCHYGEETGIKIARKHVSWYSKGLENSAEFRVVINQADNASAMEALIDKYYNNLLNSQP
jgi:tRNA-dihydrouridine synthase B